MKTIIQLNKILADIESTRQAVISEIHQNPYYREIQSILSDPFNFDPEAQQLIAFINDREHPMSRDEIALVFEGSGFSYTEQDIDACNPETEHYVAAYSRELCASIDY